MQRTVRLGQFPGGFSGDHPRSAGRMANQFAVRVVVITCTTQHTGRIGFSLLAYHHPGPGWIPDEVGFRAMERVTFDCDHSQLGLEVGSAGVLAPASAALSYVDHFRSRQRVVAVPGRPVKRKREDWAGPGLGHRDNDRISKPVEPCQRPSQLRSSSHEAYFASISSTAEAFRPLIRGLQQLDNQTPVLTEQAARLVARYWRLWESQLQVVHATLVEEQAQMGRRCRDADARIGRFRDAIQKMWDGVIEMFEK
ncbi:hypothetical protein BDQ94DRAFT_180364 [Aspergillus welwitschiae]|uniref:Uncharacterized protein n=1 Tax=Aspergillus welwitschiae TaxID=1341132 RepID=A0A3F3PGU9_9EURO|nr:hypothetical protein BDQ94DRAFT_180364 [Aspergillus welwitschiae]RDH26135.1 hypothetical protein BDQ94DRAFT_180364 [Aspergillus welwitschiae]